MVTGPDEFSNLPGFEFRKGVFYPLGSILFVLFIPFGLRGSVSTRSEMVMTYIHRLQHLSPITIGQGSFGFTPLLELPELIFGDLRVHILDLLETFAFFIDLLLYPGSPAGQGGAHLCEGGFVYFVPMIICVLILSGELVSCVQLLEEECVQVDIIFMPEILSFDRDGCPGDRRHLPTVPFDDKVGLQRNPCWAHFGNFLPDRVDRVRAPVLRLLLLLRRIATTPCALAAISGFITRRSFGFFLRVFHLIILALRRMVFFIVF